MLDLDALGRATVHEPGGIPHVVFAGFASAISTVLIPCLDRQRRHATIEITEAEDCEALRDLGLGSVDVVLTQEHEGIATERRWTGQTAQRLLVEAGPAAGAWARAPAFGAGSA
jgi:hypothetical protein